MFHFDDKDLRLVLAIDRCGNISEAARSVHLAVSSASARLTELESRLDVRLFERPRTACAPHRPEKFSFGTPGK